MCMHKPNTGSLSRFAHYQVKGCTFQIQCLCFGDVRTPAEGISRTKHNGYKHSVGSLLHHWAITFAFQHYNPSNKTNYNCPRLYKVHPSIYLILTVSSYSKGKHWVTWKHSLSFRAIETWSNHTIGFNSLSPSRETTFDLVLLFTFTRIFQ